MYNRLMEEEGEGEEKEEEAVVVVGSIDGPRAGSRLCGA